MSDERDESEDPYSWFFDRESDQDLYQPKPGISKLVLANAVGVASMVLLTGVLIYACTR